MPRKRHLGSLQRRGDSYRVHLCVGGQRYRFTIPTTDRYIAARFAVARHQELRRQHERRAAGLPSAVRFSKLVDQFEREELPTRAPGTQEAFRDSLKPIRSYFVETLRDPALDQIHAKHITQFLSWRRVNRLDGSAPLSNRTLAKDRAVLHRLFAIAERLEYRDGNPVARVDPPKWDERDPVLLTDDEFERLLTACADRPMLRRYALCLGETGGRCESEVLRLRWEDLDLEGGFLWVASGRDGHRTKSGKGRWIPNEPTAYLCHA